MKSIRFIKVSKVYGPCGTIGLRQRELPLVIFEDVIISDGCRLILELEYFMFLFEHCEHYLICP
ncbi:hypothetical protein [Butyricimonas paravirosa]